MQDRVDEDYCEMRMDRLKERGTDARIAYVAPFLYNHFAL